MGLFCCHLMVPLLVLHGFNGGILSFIIGVIILLPGGSVGKKYVELLNQEQQNFVSGSFPAERVIVFKFPYATM